MPNELKPCRDRLIDGKEYARQMRENAVKDENGIVRVSIELWEQIADIIERAIVPPCKVGDTIWVIDIADVVMPIKVRTVDEICVDRENIVIAKNEYGLRYGYLFNCFGKTVFLTKEEAEEKLKELGK